MLQSMITYWIVELILKINSFDSDKWIPRLLAWASLWLKTFLAFFTGHFILSAIEIADEKINQLEEELKRGKEQDS
jgi:hypothetical protein